MPGDKPNPVESTATDHVSPGDSSNNQSSHRSFIEHVHDVTSSGIGAVRDAFRAMSPTHDIHTPPLAVDELTQMGLPSLVITGDPYTKQDWAKDHPTAAKTLAQTTEALGATAATVLAAPETGPGALVIGAATGVALDLAIRSSLGMPSSIHTATEAAVTGAAGPLGSAAVGRALPFLSGLPRLIGNTVAGSVARTAGTTNWDLEQHSDDKSQPIFPTPGPF